MSTITISLPAQIAKQIDIEIKRQGFSTRSEFIRSLLRKYFAGEPAYGSDDWWDWSDKKALDDIKAGRYTKVQDKKQLNQFLSSLKTQ